MICEVRYHARRAFAPRPLYHIDERDQLRVSEKARFRLIAKPLLNDMMMFMLRQFMMMRHGLGRDMAFG